MNSQMVNKYSLFSILLCFWFLLSNCKDTGQGTTPPTGTTPVAVEKTNPTKVYMHYMPWFHGKEFSGYWGSHWRMNNRNPDKILPNGQREIASHYYPLIGPYDSADPDVVDYHTLLMKYAGIDGMLVDWYGSYNVLDYASNLKNSNALLDGAERTGLGYAIVYEDNTANEAAKRKGITAVEAAQVDMEYVRTNYFSSDNYIKLNNKPLFLTFGPRHFVTPDQWTSIFSNLNVKPSFFSLWYHFHRIGEANGTGTFSWVDFDPLLPELASYYQSTTTQIKIPSAYPGFHDYYVNGGWGDSYGHLPHNDGQIMLETLNRARSFKPDYLQLVTWNDFGEGTMIEPTAEFGYRYLNMIQDFTGVMYSTTDLERVHQYYLKRKEHKEDPDKQVILDTVFNHLIRLETEQAQQLLNNL